jgi:hypothetical protein
LIPTTTAAPSKGKLPKPRVQTTIATSKSVQPTAPKTTIAAPEKPAQKPAQKTATKTSPKAPAAKPKAEPKQ